jgi:hypothetical protein
MHPLFKAVVSNKREKIREWKIGNQSEVGPIFRKLRRFKLLKRYITSFTQEFFLLFNVPSKHGQKTFQLLIPAKKIEKKSREEKLMIQ